MQDTKTMLERVGKGLRNPNRFVNIGGSYIPWTQKERIQQTIFNLIDLVVDLQKENSLEKIIPSDTITVKDKTDVQTKS